MSANEKKPPPIQRGASLLPVILLAALAGLVIGVPLLFNWGCPLGPTASTFSTLEDLSKGRKPGAYVAHGFGEIDGHFYTNSRDAFLLNYERGYRAFEVDLILLQDGSPFCAHDGSEWMYGLDKPFTETVSAELSGRLCLGKYNLLTGSDLLDLMSEYTDAVFLLDAKRTSQKSNHAILEALVSEARERHPTVLDRMIPHTFGPTDLWKVATIHDFTDYWVAVYSLRFSIDRSASAEPDRVVLYVISHGGAAQFRRRADIKLFTPSWNVLGDAISLLRCPSLGLIHSLCGTRLCVSLDIMEADPEASSS